MNTTATHPATPAAGLGRRTRLRAGVTLVFLAWVAALFFNGERLPAIAAVMVLLALWFALVLDAVRREGLPGGDRLLPAAMALFLGWLVFSSRFGQVPYLAHLNVWWLGLLPGVFLIAWLDPRREAFLEAALGLLRGAGVALAAVALAQHFLLDRDPAGPFHTRNSLADLLSLLVFPWLEETLRSHGPARVRAAAALFLLVLAIGTIQSRGALLGLALGLGIFAGLGLARPALARWRLPTGAITAALLAAWLLSLWHPVTGSDLLQRAVTLQDVPAAGHGRFVIWEPAFRLFLERPWLGIGPGSYFMVIPPWLDPADRSAHFYVHNDYLQLALETGLPGLLALLLVALAALRLLRAGLARWPRGSERRLTLLAPFAALFGLAFHSAFTFNLYMLPTTLVAALLFARLHATVAGAVAARGGNLLQALRPGLFRAMQAALVLAVALPFGRLVLADRATETGRALATEARLEEAHARFLAAQRHAPEIDTPWYTDADLLRRSAALLPDRPALARELLEEALRKADRAIALNPYRPHSHTIRGQILAALRPGDPRAAAAWREALARDPRYLPARLDLARRLMDEKRDGEALALLRAGLDLSYPLRSPDLMAYLDLVERLARRTGDIALADRIERSRARLEALRGKEKEDEPR